MKPGRNAPCPCGSGRKYKLCCLPKEAGDDDRRPWWPSQSDLPPGARIVEHRGQRMIVSKGVDEKAIEAAAEHFERKRRGVGFSDQLAAFSQPLIDAAGDSDAALQNAMSLGAICWNIAIVGDEKERARMIDDTVRDVAESESQAQELRDIIADMIDRHREMFPEEHGTPGRG